MWPHYIYLHRQADSGEPFYVGKGAVHRREPYRRAHAKQRRGEWWQRVAAKHGVVVEIVAHCLTDEEAQQQERALIARIGRHDLGLGPLVNLTDGGDGHAGIVVSEKLRATRSANARGPRSASWIASMRAARKNGGNGGVVKVGDKLPEAWRANLAAAKVGDKNPMHGRCGKAHPNGRRVIDAAGTQYPTVTAAARAIGVRMQTLHNMLTGFRPNSSGMRFI